MGFNFPNAPLEGEIYQPPGGPTYVWRSPVWEATGEGHSNDEIIAPLVKAVQQLKAEVEALKAQLAA